tara:strand:- start:30 stop:1400 length:1371 start_codon:yes stop_codon:yes gene_type:complete
MSDQVAEVRATYLTEATQDTVMVGYKKTEVGVIPENWNISTIEEAIAKKFILDQMDGNHGELYPKSHEFSSYGIPYVGATDFYSGHIDYKNCKYLPERRAKKFKKGVAINGDVLFAHNATVGPVAIVNSNFEFIIISTTATYYRLDNSKINNLYLASFFDSAAFIKQFSAVMSQSTRNQVPILSQRKFYLVLPPIEEQTAIANALSDVDTLINELEKLVAKKQAIKTATMQQLLTGRTRLPEFALHEDGTPKGYKQSELGEIPEDWEVEEFSNLASPSSSRVNPKLYGGGDFCIELEHINQGNGYLSGFTTTNAGSSLKNIFEEGDVLFGKLRAYLKKYWFSDRAGVCSTEIWVLKAKVQKSLSNFIFYLVQTEKFIEAASEAYGTHMPRADWKVISLLPIATPRKKEQTAIAKILSDMDAEIQSLEQRLGKTRQIKQGMMQELLTGKTRLVAPAA